MHVMYGMTKIYVVYTVAKFGNRTTGTYRQHGQPRPITSRKFSFFFLWNSHIYSVFIGTSMDFATLSSRLVKKIAGLKHYFVPTGT